MVYKMVFNDFVDARHDFDKSKYFPIQFIPSLSRNVRLDIRFYCVE